MIDISFGSDILDGRHVVFPHIERNTTRDPSPDPNGWKRVLYEYNPSIPDNYTSIQFLSGLSINSGLSVYKYWPSVVSTATAFSLHALMIPVYFVVYYNLSVTRLRPLDLITIDVLILIVGYVSRELVVRKMMEGVEPARLSSINDDEVSSPSSTVSPTSPSISDISPSTVSKQREKLFKDMYRAILLFTTVYVLSPLLRTLTNSWNHDTILTIGIVMFLLHVVFHDYGFVNRRRSTMDEWLLRRGSKSRVVNGWKRVETSVSLNAIVFSAVVLGSRLESSEALFAFVFFSMTSFAFLPFAFKWVLFSHPKAFLGFLLPCTSAFSTWLLMVHAGLVISSIYLLAFGVAIFVGPMLLILCLPLKRSIKGPWDIAHVVAKDVPSSPVHSAADSDFSYHR
jgi:hypothetical protein